MDTFNCLRTCAIFTEQKHRVLTLDNAGTRKSSTCLPSLSALRISFWTTVRADSFRAGDLFVIGTNQATFCTFDYRSFSPLAFYDVPHQKGYLRVRIIPRHSLLVTATTTATLVWTLPADGTRPALVKELKQKPRPTSLYTDDERIICGIGARTRSLTYSNKVALQQQILLPLTADCCLQATRPMTVPPACTSGPSRHLPKRSPSRVRVHRTRLPSRTCG